MARSNINLNRDPGDRLYEPINYDTQNPEPRTQCLSSYAIVKERTAEASIEACKRQRLRPHTISTEMMVVLCPTNNFVGTGAATSGIDVCRTDHKLCVLALHRDH
jgi:hypothetical protein